MNVCREIEGCNLILPGKEIQRQIIKTLNSLNDLMMYSIKFQSLSTRYLGCVRRKVWQLYECLPRSRLRIATGVRTLGRCWDRFGRVSYRDVVLQGHRLTHVGKWYWNDIKWHQMIIDFTMRKVREQIIKPFIVIILCGAIWLILFWVNHISLHV